MCYALLIVPIQFVDVVFGLPDVVLWLPPQHFNLHDGGNQQLNEMQNRFYLQERFYFKNF